MSDLESSPLPASFCSLAALSQGYYDAYGEALDDAAAASAPSATETCSALRPAFFYIKSSLPDSSVPLSPPVPQAGPRRSWCCTSAPTSRSTASTWPA